MDIVTWLVVGLFQASGWRAPFKGLAGVITIAFAGAVILLVGLRLIRAGTRRTRT